MATSTEQSAVPSRGERAMQWWQDLQGDNTGAIQALRRVRTPLESIMVPATLELMVRLGWRRVPDDRRDFDGERIALLAALLSHVDGMRRDSLARIVGKRGDDAGLVSPVRWSRLMGCESTAELFSELVPIVEIADRRCNVADLATTLLNWSNPARNVRQKWTYDYYGLI
jgi:CRISPR system Cascade subunit CasB